MVLPIYAALSTIFIVQFMGTLIVQEREKRLEEGLRMMGMRYAAHYLSWLSVYGVVVSFAALLTTCVFAPVFFPNSSGLFLWITLQLHGMAMLATCVLRPRPAQSQRLVAHPLLLFT